VNFNLFNKEVSRGGLCCLYLLPDQLIITHATHQNPTEPTITFIEISIYQLQSLKLILESIVKKYDLKNTPCSWVLHPSYYQLFLLDPPSVAADEIPLALRWQIKELINFSAQNAAIDYFAVPSTMESKKKIYAAVAESATLQTIADIIHEAELDLQFIDIPQLALRNVNALYGDALCYLGLLSFTQDHIEFIVTHENNLLLSRQLTLPSGIDNDALILLSQSTTPASWVSELSNEIQHSFTFCKSQQQKEIPAKLLVAVATPEWVTYFGGLLNIETEQLHVEKKLQFESGLQTDDYLSHDYLIAVGGALRNIIQNAE